MVSSHLVILDPLIFGGVFIQTILAPITHASSYIRLLSICFWMATLSSFSFCIFLSFLKSAFMRLDSFFGPTVLDSLDFSDFFYSSIGESKFRIFFSTLRVSSAELLSRLISSSFCKDEIVALLDSMPYFPSALSSSLCSLSLSTKSY